MELNKADQANMKMVGQLIRTERLKQGFSIARLAAQADIDPTYLSRIEKGTNLSVVFLCRLAECLKVEVNQLLPHNFEREQPQENEDVSMETAAELAPSATPAQIVDVQDLKDAGLKQLKIGDSILIL